MHQIQFRLGLCPRPRQGSLHRSPRPQAEFKGCTSTGSGRGRKGEKSKDEGERIGWKERGRAREGKRRVREGVTISEFYVLCDALS